MKDIIQPVIESARNPHLRAQLLDYFPRQGSSYASIERSFQALVSGSHDVERLSCFFSSWSMTNNSAMTVAGIANRLTLLRHKNQEVRDPMRLLQALTSLHRIVDEDLGVVGGVLHKDLYMRMAAHFCGSDAWQSHRYVTPQAAAFKKWKDAASLRDKDIMNGLLTTIVHEIYTHGEVEYILPLFRNWLRARGGVEGREANVILAWIIVHTGPTEKNHFFHAIDAAEHYAGAMGIDLARYDMEEIVRAYMSLKAEAMDSISQVLAGGGIACAA
jgi:hypothetical protein